MSAQDCMMQVSSMIESDRPSDGLKRLNGYHFLVFDVFCSLSHQWMNKRYFYLDLHIFA
jgi:hypothetical protein